MKKDLYIFDFDGTLTRKDSLKEFIQFCVGPLRYYLGLAWLSPVLAGYAVGLVRNDVAKARLMTHFFKGWTESSFDDRGKAFAAQAIDRLIRPSAEAYLQVRKEEGNVLVVVSASMEAWLKPWCDRHGFLLLCTRMERREGRLTGKFATPNCYGAEKVRRLRDTLDLDAYQTTYAFGDSKGDHELLALADHGYYRYFH